MNFDELREQIHQLIPQLNEEQLVDLFEKEMIEAGYLSNSRRPNDGLWENAREWLNSYLDGWVASEELIEQTLQDMQCKVDYPDS